MKKHYYSYTSSIFYLAFVFSCFVSNTKAQDVSCYAGSGAASHSNGQVRCEVATFDEPTGVAIDATGNVYVADQRNHKIRKITPAGVVSTLAGSGTAGNADGTGSAASFRSPYDIIINSSGDLFVSDFGNHKIRKVTTAGVVTTFAGTGQAGIVSGAGNVARFNNPAGMNYDATGNLFIADQGNNRIRKITPDAVVSTYAGNGTSGDLNGGVSVARFNAPTSVAVTASGIVYISDTGNNKIKRITTDGVVSTFYGGAGGFNEPKGLLTDASNNLYVVLRSDNAIYKISPSAVLERFAGRGVGDGPRLSASFYEPVGIRWDASGNMFVAESSASHKIRKISAAGIVSTIAGCGIRGNFDGESQGAALRSTDAIALDLSGNLYVLGSAIKKITPAGNVTTFAGSGNYGNTNGTGTAATFGNLVAGTFDGTGNLYVSDYDNHQIKKITAAGVVTTFAGSGTAGNANGTGTAASFNRPYGLCFDAQGNLYVADTYNNQIKKITAAGVVTTFAGSGTAGSTNGPKATATFNSPNSITIDGNGKMYIIDRVYNLIRMISTDGLVSTFAGSGSAGNTNGIGTAASFRSPYGIKVDATGNIYLADSQNHRIRKITPDGTVSTFAGSSAGYINGTGISACFSTPFDIAINASGTTLYVADRDNHRIRKIIVNPIITSISEEQEQLNNSMLLYPNPAKEKLHMNIEHEGLCDIMDYTGATISSLIIEDNSINVNTLKPGIYLLKVKTNKGYAVQKFIKE